MGREQLEQDLADVVSSLDGVEGMGGLRLERLSGGASRQTSIVWLDGLEGPGASRYGDRLVLQVSRPGALEASLAFSVEARLLRAAAEAGVAVPAAVGANGLDGAGPIDGRSWMLTDFVEGETIARKLLRDDEYAEARKRLVSDCGGALAGVHSIDPSGFPELRTSNPVEESSAILSMFDEPHPAFELAMRWLAERRAAGRDPTVVHGDFRLGNLIVDGNGLAAVIDWELAHLGDPHEDLAWLCIKAWRFGETGVVAGLGTIEELLSSYRSAGGVDVDPEALQWWMVAGTLRWGAICMLQAHTHLSGANRSVELAAIGRRVAETELDLLELLGIATPDAVASVLGQAEDTQADPAGLHGRPTAMELVESVREYIDGPVSDETTGRTNFHARVAARSLAIAERELLLGAQMAEEHTRRLESLGLSSERDLVEAVRGGRYADGDDQRRQVEEVILESVVDKLRVANPGYLP